jgi:glc operon protein GlcG
MVAVNDFTPLQGGVPIVVDGQVVGGIGVSGAASAQEDEELALAGANALATRAAPVAFFDHGKVAAAFAKGTPLIEVDGYKVQASRREAPGQAEVHVQDTDIIHVLKGSGQAPRYHRGARAAGQLCLGRC